MFTQWDDFQRCKEYVEVACSAPDRVAMATQLIATGTRVLDQVQRSTLANQNCKSLHNADDARVFRETDVKVLALT
jgi:putative ubiquitin-RnfH superfamily antitoxin RatB of RatAB toxin-antitoxin module